MSKFEWLRKIVNWLKEPFLHPTIVAAESAGREPPTPQPESIEKRFIHAGEIRSELEKIREENIRNEFLSTPKTNRLSHQHSCQPPAEQHRAAISKFMKGKASSRYLRTIKQSPKIRIDDEVED